ncbi:MAG: hypothetical protein BJBARM5_0526 [Candidatus Parvarchaeum acidophilus ARMAN-5]|uniref:Uncharacterized protein n=1 Tax=Candidatus Parvarchaeum acidophilus ARMAN-5 TaxID=662762 RepID=D6GVL3_PARA5|nr:MAG: hypothetical protein BJBARM5_0526 [Candidatus Parvarchaeum acidophilus ARMAN-5]
MKLDGLLSALGKELDELEKDEDLGRVAAYVNESWRAKSSFIIYVVAKYTEKNQEWKKELSPKKYFITTAAAMIGSATVISTLQGTFSFLDLLSVFVIGYSSLAISRNLLLRKQEEYAEKSLNYAIGTGRLNQYLLEFYSNFK